MGNAHSDITKRALVSQSHHKSRGQGIAPASEIRLEDDERLEDTIELFVHDLERFLHLVKWEGMGRHERGIDALHLQHAQEAFHSQTATRTQAGRNRLFRHADTPLETRNMHKVTVTMVPNIGDGATGFCDFDSILESDIGSQRLDRCVHPLSISQVQDALDHVLFGEISDCIGTIDACKFLPARHRFYSDDQPGATQLRPDCCHQSHRTLGEDGYRSPDRNMAILCTHEPGREHVGTVDRHLIGHAGRNTGHIRIGLVHMKVLGKHAILGIGEFPSSQRSTGLGGVTSLRGEIAPTRTRSPGLKRVTLLPTSWTMPTASCPRVRFSRGPMAPPTVWESEVQMRALVVLTTASFGPGWGMGFSMKPTCPIAFMLVPFFALLHQFAYAHRPAYTRNRDRVQDLTSCRGNIVYRFPMRKYTLVRSQTRHSTSMFCHNWSTMCSRQSDKNCLLP